VSDCTEQSFLADVAAHEMIVLRDDDVYRHIRFKKPGTSCMFFDLITWPGVLCYTGDMGTYVFSRLEDMFQFFRTDANSDWMRRRGLTLGINEGYWSEKLKASDSNGRHSNGATEFDEDRFRAVVNEYRLEWVRGNRRVTTKDERRELWEEIDSGVLGELDNAGHAAMAAAYGFSYSADHAAFEFTDLFEHNFERFTYHFTWCCYALAWGIKKYDEARALSEAAA
jgi:hypothetical protein